MFIRKKARVIAVLISMIVLVCSHPAYSQTSTTTNKGKPDAAREDSFPPPKSQSNMPDRIGELLRTHTFRLFLASNRPKEEARFCGAVMADLVQPQKISFLPPVLATDRNDHPELAKYQACKEFDHDRSGTEELLRYEGLAATTGDHHFRLYRLPTKPAPIEVIYGEFSEENRLNRFDSYAVVDLEQCRIIRSVPVARKQLGGGGANESAVVKRSGVHYVLTVTDDGRLAMDLWRIERSGPSSWACHWNAERK